MLNGIVRVPPPVNEPVLAYAPGSPERASLKQRLDRDAAPRRVEIPLVIGGEEVRTGNVPPRGLPARPRARARHLPPGRPRRGASRRSPRRAWPGANGREMPWEERAAIFLKAADLLAGPWRDTVNAATMLGQSKTVYQAEIDAAGELIDFWRFNPHFLQQLYADQPISVRGIWNAVEYRPLEGFVFAVTPFNFTSIGGNLPTAPALDGQHRAVEAGVDLDPLQLLRLQGARSGGAAARGDQLRPRPRRVGRRSGLRQPGLRGPALHRLDRDLPAACGGRSATTSARYKSYPRIVGETGGKDFVFAHPSADARALVVALVRGAFEYQGQKCSAASRAYVPKSLWPAGRERPARRDRARCGMGPPTRLPQLHVRGDRRGVVRQDDGLRRARAGLVGGGDRGRRPRRQVARLLRRADGGADRGPALQADGARRSSGRCSRCYVYDDATLERDARALRHHQPVRADRRHLRRRTGAEIVRADQGAAPRRRQLLHQRQADRRGGGPAAVRRRARARAPTTRPARSGTCCAGSRCARSRRTSCRRRRSPTRTWEPSRPGLPGAPVR